MRYIYSNRNLISVDSISLMEIFQDKIVLTLNSGRKLSVFSTKKSDDLEYVFNELSKKIRRDDYNIDMNNFQLHMKIYRGIEEGTWYL
jgi:hypothetical protein